MGRGQLERSTWDPSQGHRWHSKCGQGLQKSGQSSKNAQQSLVSRTELLLRHGKYSVQLLLSRQVQRAAAAPATLAGKPNKANHQPSKPAVPLVEVKPSLPYAT